MSVYQQAVVLGYLSKSQHMLVDVDIPADVGILTDVGE